jgi:predicted transcriptional regulator
MDEIDGLTDLQLGVMQVLWEQGEATAAEVRRELGAKRSLAPTTVATLLSRLEKKGLVAHRADGRQFVFRASVGEPQVRRALVDAVLRRLFHGDRAALIRYLSEPPESAGEPPPGG